jgi:hypothetical protein
MRKQEVVHETRGLDKEQREADESLEACCAVTRDGWAIWSETIKASSMPWKNYWEW